MTIRTASWLAAAAAGILGAATAAPALAQDGRYDPGPPPPLPEWEEDWEEYPEQDYGDTDPRWEEHRGPHGDAPDADHGEWRGHPLPAHGQPHAMGYPSEQRAQWLEQCRARYRDDRGRERGQVIGGVLGAVAGGIAGREIADAGDNLGGTLIGAGVGGLAGAAIGGAIGGQSDRGRLDECEDYLVRYEQSYRGYSQEQGAVGYHYPYPYPVMWVKVPIHTVRRGDCGCETVVEEWVEEEPAPPPRARRTKIRRIAPAPAPAPGKRVRTIK